METAKPNGSIEIDKFLERDITRKVLNSVLRQVEAGPEEMSADNLHTLLGRVAEASTQLHGLGETLVSDGVRIQNDIAR
jgi:hypothetical protein